jgi:hypothetical protein
VGLDEVDSIVPATALRLTDGGMGGVDECYGSNPFRNCGRSGSRANMYSPITEELLDLFDDAARAKRDARLAGGGLGAMHLVVEHAERGLAPGVLPYLPSI